MTAAVRTVGVIGLGAMGAPMARNLMKAGFGISVWARRPQSAEGLVAEGARLRASPADLARSCDAVVTVVTADADVRAVLLGPSGVIEGARPGLLVIDHSTIAPSTARDCAQALAARGVDCLDAPVSGGEVGAVAGTLSVMAGGSEGAYARAEPLFAAIGRTRVRVGDSGAGQVAKAANQLALCVTLQAMAEAVMYAQRQGCAAGPILEAAGLGLAASRILEVMGPRMASGDHRAGVESRLHWKDLRIVLEVAREAGVPLPGTALATQTFSALQAAGGARRDSSAIVTVLRAAGLPPADPSDASPA
ncbi:MAG: NAD(P)-dependent oxidoreductase [Pseudomonadota bacterium]|jgi:2-hydroxy-3-oxopropionate reductase